MPAKLDFDLTGITEDLDALLRSAVPAASVAVYEGACVVADAVNAAAKGLKTSPRGKRIQGMRYLYEDEKAAIQGACGVARHRKSGFEVQTSVGFSQAGYAQVYGRRKPVPLLVNAANSGTSFMYKQPFVTTTFARVRPQVQAAMQAAALQRIDNSKNGG